MNRAQTSKYFQVIAPAAIVDNTVFSDNEIDTKGFAYCTIILNIGATDIAMAACKVRESDTSGSGYVDVSGLDLDGDTDVDGNTAALPSDTDDNSIVAFEIDLRGRKRYLVLKATAGDGAAGTYASAVAVLSRAHEGLQSAASRGAETIMRV